MPFTNHTGSIACLLQHFSNSNSITRKRPAISRQVSIKGHPSDTGLLEETTRKVLENNPGPVEQYKSGKTKVLGFLVGQVMKEMKGKANPAAAGELLQKLLSE